MQNILGTSGAISRPSAMGRRTDGGSFQALRTWLVSLGPFLLRLAIP
jgi:hypothetical protein